MRCGGAGRSRGPAAASSGRRRRRGRRWRGSPPGLPPPVLTTPMSSPPSASTASATSRAPAPGVGEVAGERGGRTDRPAAPRRRARWSRLTTATAAPSAVSVAATARPRPVDEPSTSARRPSSPRSTSARAQPDRAAHGVEVHHRRAELLVVGRRARLLDAAERRVERGADGRPVDAHHPGLDLGREALRGGERARADRRRQAVVDVVGRLDRLVERADALERRSPGRTPRPAPADAGRDVDEHGRREEPAVGELAVVEPRHRRARTLRPRRARRGDRSAPSPSTARGRRSAGPSSRRRDRRARARGGRRGRRRRRASSSWTASSTSTRPAPVQACPVSEKDDRATTSAAASRSASASTTTGFLPPSSSCSRCPRPGSGVDLVPGGVRSGEGDGVDVGVGHEVGAGGEPVHDVEHAGRQAGVDERLRRAARPSAASSATA